MVGIVETLRARVLELALEIEKKLPEASEIAIGQASPPSQSGNAATVTHIINVTVQQGDTASVTKALREGGIPDADAKEFAELIASEKPEDLGQQPFGAKAKAWILANMGKALNGTWKVGADVAVPLLTEAAKRYYGLS